MKKTSLCFASLLLASALLFAGCAQKKESSPETETKVQMIEIEDTLSYAVMAVTKNGETRQERAANREDLKTLKDYLINAKQTGEKEISYDSQLNLVTEGGKEVTVHMNLKEGFITVEGGDSYQMSKEGADFIEGLYTTLEGWMKYGDQVKIEMKKKEIKTDESELSITLYNNTGSPIDYITSPIIYQVKADGSLVQVESIGGFCGFVSHLDGEKAEIKIPFKGMFDVTEPGNYQIEIQAMAEEELRWGISAPFQIVE